MLTPSGQSKCKRCGRWFQPCTPEQEYGPKCAAIIAAQMHLFALITPEELEDDRQQ